MPILTIAPISINKTLFCFIITIPPSILPEGLYLLLAKPFSLLGMGFPL
jgi:hypothetical protein